MACLEIRRGASNFFSGACRNNNRSTDTTDGDKNIRTKMTRPAQRILQFSNETNNGIDNHKQDNSAWATRPNMNRWAAAQQGHLGYPNHIAAGTQAIVCDDERNPGRCSQPHGGDRSGYSQGLPIMISESQWSLVGTRGFRGWAEFRIAPCCPALLRSKECSPTSVSLSGNAAH